MLDRDQGGKNYVPTNGRQDLGQHRTRRKRQRNGTEKLEAGPPKDHTSGYGPQRTLRSRLRSCPGARRPMAGATGRRARHGDQRAPGIITGTDPVPSWRRAQDPQRAAEARVRSELAQAALGLTVVIEKGETAEAIMRVAEEQGCGLIVTGWRGTRCSGAWRSAPRSTSWSGARTSRCWWCASARSAPTARSSWRQTSPRPRAMRWRRRCAFSPQTVITLFHAYDPPLSGRLRRGIILGAAPHRSRAGRRGLSQVGRFLRLARREARNPGRAGRP